MRFLKESYDQKHKDGVLKRYVLKGDEIKKERLRLKLTVRQVAAELGISTSYLREVELNLKKSCNEKVYFKLLDYYNRRSPYVEPTDGANTEDTNH